MQKVRTPRLNEAVEFADIWNNIDQYPTVQDVAEYFNIHEKTAGNWASVYRSESVVDSDFPFIMNRATNALPPKEEMIAKLKILGDVKMDDFLVEANFEEQDIQKHFGTWSELKRQAGLSDTRGQAKIHNQTALHAAADIKKKFNIQRQSLSEVYLKPTNKRLKTIMVLFDVHDIMVDPFYLSTAIDTAKRIQPDVICFGGDLFDLPEFSKYTVDPREWDVVGRIKFVHENVLRPFREACPNAQMDLLESNHEIRIIVHLSEASPAMKSILGDLHGFTVGSLLGLDKYEVNYIAKADLRARTKSDIKNELGKNYIVYDDQFMVHHYPSGRKYGIPGCSGHHHKHIVWPEFSHVFGSYSWHQCGSGHMREASFCDAEIWNNGFLIATLDTESNRTVMEYVEIGETIAVSAGKIYSRE